MLCGDIYIGAYPKLHQIGVSKEAYGGYNACLEGVVPLARVWHPNEHFTPNKVFKLHSFSLELGPLCLKKLLKLYWLFIPYFLSWDAI